MSDLKAGDPSRTPVYRWGQRPQSVHITLELAGVNASSSSLDVTATTLTFRGAKRSSPDQLFHLQLLLAGEVVPEACEMAVKDREVLIVLKKKANEKWAALQKPGAPRVKACEKVDWDFWKDSDDEGENEQLDADDPVAKYLKAMGSEAEEPESRFVTWWNKLPTRHLSLQDLLFWVVLVAQMVFAVMNKVEESFNVQATHDMLFKGRHLSAYDHKVYPGVVPRTFAGAALLSAMSWPLHYLGQEAGVPKVFSLYVVRFSLALLATFAFGRLRRAVTLRFGSTTGWCFTFLVCTQFHLMYYGTRLLPNTFALWLVVYAAGCLLTEDYGPMVRALTVATLVFRADVMTLAGPMVLWELLVTGRMGLRTLLVNGSLAAIVALGVTVPLDSLLWGRPVWPEFEVFYFNTVLNRSSEWGVSPPLWYFTSALPRALLVSLPLLPAGLYLERKRLLHVLVPALASIVVLSLLPHKELRFIFPSIALLTIPAAVALSRLVKLSEKNEGILWAIFAFVGAGAMISGMFLTVSALNYPGGSALRQVHAMEEMAPSTFTPYVHLDVATCQTGVSQFLELPRPWRYSKDESLETAEGAVFKQKGFTHILSARKKIDGYTNYFKTDVFKRVIWEFPSPYPDFEPFIYGHRRSDLVPMSAEKRKQKEQEHTPPDSSFAQEEEEEAKRKEEI